MTSRKKTRSNANAGNFEEKLSKSWKAKEDNVEAAPGGSGYRLIAFDIFVALSLSVTFFFLVEVFAIGGDDSTNSWVFTSCSVPVFHLQELGDVWKGRLTGLLLAGWLFDLLVKHYAYEMDLYVSHFAMYEAVWLFLLFLVVILALRRAPFVILGIFAGLMYNFSPASGQYFYPWDMPATLFFTLAVLFFERRQMLMMAAAICAGCFFKETVMVCALLAFFAGHWKWWKRILTFTVIVAVYVVGKKILLGHLAFQVAAFSMENATNLTTLFRSTSVADNIKTLLSPTLNHVIFANAGTLAAVLVLGWRRRFLPYMTIILAFVAGHFLFAGIGEFHQLWQILPLSLMILSERWGDYAMAAGSAAAAGEPSEAWQLRGTFPVLVPLMIVLAVGSAVIGGYQYYRLNQELGAVFALSYKDGVFSMPKKPVVNGNLDPVYLETASALFKSQYGKVKSNIAMSRALNKRDSDSLEAHSDLLKKEFVGSELNLASICVSKSKPADAIDHYRQALEMDTNSASAMSNLATLLATASDPGLRNGKEAVRLAEQACQQTQYKEVTMVRTLAAAYAEAGRFDDAVVTARKVCTMDLTQRNKEFVPMDEDLVELYKSGQPYHQVFGAAP